MRIVFTAILWGIGGAIFGAINGAAIGWALGWSMATTAMITAAVVGVLSMIYGAFIVAPKPSSKKKTSTSRPEKPKFNFRSCAWCQGTGVEGKGKSKKQCSVCGGQKQVLVESPYSECPKCKGKGHVSLKRRCKVCHGAGWNTYAFIE